jgi:hypothetical protein
MKLNKSRLRKMILKEVYNLSEATSAASIGKVAGGGKSGDSKVRLSVYKALLGFAASQGIAGAPVALGLATRYTISPNFRIHVHGKLDDAKLKINAAPEMIKKAISEIYEDLLEYYKTQEKDFEDIF